MRQESRPPVTMQLAAQEASNRQPILEIEERPAYDNIDSKFIDPVGVFRCRR